MLCLDFFSINMGFLWKIVWRAFNCGQIPLAPIINSWPMNVQNGVWQSNSPLLNAELLSMFFKTITDNIQNIFLNNREAHFFQATCKFWKFWLPMHESRCSDSLSFWIAFERGFTRYFDGYKSEMLFQFFELEMFGEFLQTPYEEP